MEDKLISAKALLDKLPIVEDWDKRVSLVGALSDFIILICNAPTIEAKPIIHAYWEKENDLFFVCSNCGTTCPYNFESDFITHWECKYCPICGAQMDEKESD